MVGMMGEQWVVCLVGERVVLSVKWGGRRVGKRV